MSKKSGRAKMGNAIANETLVEYEEATRLCPTLMRQVRLALLQGRGLTWLTKDKSQTLYGLGIIDIDEEGKLVVKPEFEPLLRSPIRYEGGSAPVSGVINKNPGEVPENQIACG